MTRHNVTPQHRPVLIAPLLAVACGADVTASTAHGASSENVVEHSDKVVGGGGLSLSIYEARKAGARPVVFIHGFSRVQSCSCTAAPGTLRISTMRVVSIAILLRSSSLSGEKRARVSDSAMVAPRWCDEVSKGRGKLDIRRATERTCSVGGRIGGVINMRMPRRTARVDFTAISAENSTHAASEHLPERSGAPVTHRRAVTRERPRLRSDSR